MSKTQAGALGRGAGGAAAAHRHFQIVLTVPPQLHRFFRRAPQVCFGLLFESAAEALTELARSRRKITIGFTAVLHTWNQLLEFHPHIHCVVPGGGLSLDGSRWIATSRHFLLPVKKLRKDFRDKLLAKLEHALRSGRILGELNTDIASLRRTPPKWHVYIKRPLVRHARQGPSSAWPSCHACGREMTI